MDNIRKSLSFILAAAAAVCLVCGVAIFLWQGRQDEHSKRLLESMRQSAEENAEQPFASAPSGTADIPVTADVSDSQPESGQPGSFSSEEPVSPASEESASPTSETSDVFPSEEPAPLAPEESLAATAENPYRDSFLANGDMAAWLKIDDTVINYPVMWTPRDENYYLKRNFEGKSDQNGCLILDTDSCLSPLTTNLIIHGHNMRSGAMFGHLMDYADPDYCKEHSTITLCTEEYLRNYEVLAVFRSQVYRKKDTVFKFYKFFQADTEEEFDDFYQNIKALSLYDTGVTAQFGDHFLTLSTCAYHVEQGRFVVVAKETEVKEKYLPFRE